MASAIAVDGPEGSATPRTDAGLDPMNEVLRDITRGGLAGLLVGVPLAGVGGRLVMRLAALLVPEATGSITEQGFVVGRITSGGTLGLIIAMGLLGGAVAGSLWVTMRPWLPASATRRALVSVPVAVALGTFVLIDDANPDFLILGHDPLVVASLILLVTLFGPALALADGWLDRRLPHARVTGDGRIVAGYAIVTAIGVLLTLVLIVPFYLAADVRLAGVALLVVGLCTLASWWYRVERERQPPPRVGLVARASLSVAVIAGLVLATREVLGALALG
jgi:hypothetical protein